MGHQFSFFRAAAITRLICICVTRYNLHSQPPRGHRFSFFRALWLIWSMLFKAAVNVNFPKGMAARYLTMVWALFAVVSKGICCALLVMCVGLALCRVVNFVSVQTSYLIDLTNAWACQVRQISPIIHSTGFSRVLHS